MDQTKVERKGGTLTGKRCSAQHSRRRLRCCRHCRRRSSWRPQAAAAFSVAARRGAAKCAARRGGGGSSSQPCRDVLAQSSCLPDSTTWLQQQVTLCHVFVLFQTTQNLPIHFLAMYFFQYITKIIRCNSYRLGCSRLVRKHFFFANFLQHHRVHRKQNKNSIS